MARIVVVGSLAESLTIFRGALIKKMLTAGHEVIACAPDADQRTRAALYAMGVDYWDIKLERVGMNALHDIRSFLDLYRLFRQIKPDVFLGYTIKPVVYGATAARLAGVPAIFSMIEGLGYAFLGKGIKSKLAGAVASVLYRLALLCSRKVFFLNHDDLAVFLQRRLVKQEQVVMLNGIGVDLKRFTEAEFPQQISFLLIARLLRDKGVREYTAAAQTVKQRYPQVRFRLVGWIDEENPATISQAELNAWVESGVVEYLGRLDDVRPAIADASVYVLPSYHEGMPVTVMEAMAMGRPVITTDAPGCREAVQDGDSGLLVAVGDVEALVQAMTYFIENVYEIERMGHASRRISEEKFDVHKVNSKMLAAMGLGR